MYNNFRRGKNKPHIPCSNRQAIFYQLETPSRFEQAHTDSQKTIPAVTKVIRETLRNIVFLDPRPIAMRDYSYAKDDDIKEDGANLSSVLYSICQKGETQKSKLLDFIRSLPEQDIIDIRFITTERNDVMVRLVESFGNHERQIDAPLLSDGTLRVLAIGATLLSAAPGTFVIIEEIDNGVHPSRADNLVKQIQAIASERKLRVLITSHNPALLDAVPDNALGDVLCCYRDPQEGDSRIVRLADLERFPELIAQGPLGQLMTKQVLDRFLKDDSTAEQRQKEALLWLEQLKCGETGNHIAQNGEGNQRRACANRFVNQVTKALEGKSPFKPISFLQPEDLQQWLIEFPDSAMQGSGLGDLSIIHDWRKLCLQNSGRRVYLWSLDEHLKNYNQEPRL
jgi:hypothetical protein